MDIETWLDNLIAPDSRRTAAMRAGYSQSTISRQLSRGHLRPETVIALCRVYGTPPVEGLVDTGWLNASELGDIPIGALLPQATNQQLLDEVMRRSDPESRELFNGDQGGQVIPMRTVPPGLYDDAVADSSPDEHEKEDDWTDPDQIP